MYDKIFIHIYRYSPAFHLLADFFSVETSILMRFATEIPESFSLGIGIAIMSIKLRN